MARCSMRMTISRASLGYSAAPKSWASTTACSSTAARQPGRRLPRVLGQARPRRIRRRPATNASPRAVAKSGSQASYNPITDVNGKPFKVVEYASDITEQKMRNADFEGQLAAISKAQAVIEFDLDGTIRSVNDNFASVMGYSNSEVRGKHHSMFCDPAISGTAEYRAFWAKLGRGEAGRRALQARRQGRPRSLVAGFVQPDPGRQWPPVQSRQVRQRRDAADADGAAARADRASRRRSR